MKKPIRWTCFFSLFGALASGAWAAPSITVGSVSGQAGTTVSLPVTFDPTSAAVSGMQFRLTLPSGLTAGTVSAGPILTTAGKQVSAHVSGNTWTFIIFGLNQSSVGSGTLLTLQLAIAPGASPGPLSLPLSNSVFSDLNGNSIVAGSSSGGSVTVVLPPPVITSAASASGGVGVAFSYQTVATNSPTNYNATSLPAGLAIHATTGLITGIPTTAGTFSVTLSATNAGGTGTKTLLITITQSPCDQNIDGLTNSQDLQLSVNQAVGITAVTRCDINADSLCNILDVQRVVNAVLGGACVITP